MQNKVVVLGGNGFIGQNLIKTLLSKEYAEVASFDCIEPSYRQEGTRYITGDFFDDMQLQKIVKDYDVIFHAISTVTPGSSNTRYMFGYEKDFIQSVKLCEYVHQKGARLIFLSSGGTVYGKQDILPVTEDVCCKPINHYGCIKYCIENVMRSFRCQNNDNMIIARISNPYGPGQDYHKGVGIIDAALRNANNRTPITIWGDGEIIRDFIYIDNVCGMLTSLITYDGPHSTFNISSNKGYSINQVIEIVRRLYPDLQVIYEPGRSVDTARIILDNNRMLDLYKEPLISLEEGIELYAKEIELK